DPIDFRERARKYRLDVGPRCEIRVDEFAAAAGALDLCRERPGLGLRPAVVHHHAPAAGREVAGDGGADPPGGAGYEGGVLPGHRRSAPPWPDAIDLDA